MKKRIQTQEGIVKDCLIPNEIGLYSAKTTFVENFPQPFCCSEEFAAISPVAGTSWSGFHRFSD